MKKIFGIVVASMMFANIGYAEMTLIEQKFIKGPKTWKDTYGLHISTVCIDGYKFVHKRKAVWFSFLKKETENHFQRSVN